MIDSTERRNNPRKPFACFARCRRPDVRTASSEKLCVVKDFSHDGIHFLFLDDNQSVWESMQLLLRFPYSDAVAAKNREYLVEVMRINSLFQGRCGVGARLVLPVATTPSTTWCLPETARPEHGLPVATAAQIDLYV
jgi:hypothetical protein